MGALDYTRKNDRWPESAVSAGPPIVAPALGTWFNCNQATGEILSLSVTRAQNGLVLRAYGAADPSPIDWGDTVAVPHVSSLGATDVSGFTANYDFGFMATQIAANLKYGVLVIQSYNTFRDGSGRPAYFSREFFHQSVSRNNPIPERAPHGDTAALEYRMVSDELVNRSDPLAGIVDLAPLSGSWRNTYRHSKGIHRVVLARESGQYLLGAWGVGCADAWGKVPAVPHAVSAGTREPAGFLARYDFGFSEISLAANEAKGLLIIASYSTFRDRSGRSSYFTREFFYRERDDPSS
jgi:hypothetical protein